MSCGVGQGAGVGVGVGIEGEFEKDGSDGETAVTVDKEFCELQR